MKYSPPARRLKNSSDYFLVIFWPASLEVTLVIGPHLSTKVHRNPLADMAQGFDEERGSGGHGSLCLQWHFPGSLRPLYGHDMGLSYVKNFGV